MNDHSRNRDELNERNGERKPPPLAMFVLVEAVAGVLSIGTLIDCFTSLDTSPVALGVLVSWGTSSHATVHLASTIARCLLGAGMGVAVVLRRRSRELSATMLAVVWFLLGFQVRWRDFMWLPEAGLWGPTMVGIQASGGGMVGWGVAFAPIALCFGVWSVLQAEGRTIRGILAGP